MKNRRTEALKWFKKMVELLKSLYEALKQEVFSCDYVQADEATVPVINKEKHRADKEYLWMVRSVMEKLVIFHYDGGSRAGAVIESLANQHHFKGYLQCDGFAGYETAFKTTPGVHLATVWYISVGILNRLWMKTGRWPNMGLRRYRRSIR